MADMVRGCWSSIGYCNNACNDVNIMLSTKKKKSWEGKERVADNQYEGILLDSIISVSVQLLQVPVVCKMLTE